MKAEEEAMRELLRLMVSVTIELQDRLRTMFLPTSERCHYIFTIRDLANIFRCEISRSGQLTFLSQVSEICDNLNPSPPSLYPLLICKYLPNEQKCLPVSEADVRKESLAAAVAE